MTTAETTRGSIRLSVLDFGAGDREPSRALEKTILTAQRAEECAYARYWLTEHQMRSGLWAGPEPLLGCIGHATRRIRIGAAGVLLRARNPLTVASDYSLLSSLFPGRVDLGLARATPSMNAQALGIVEPNPDAPGNPEDFERRVDIALRYLTGDRIADPRYPGSAAIPQSSPATAPSVWLHGSNVATRNVAARLGTCFGLSLFHRRGADASGVADYIRSFKASPLQASAQACIAIAGVCGKTRHAAEAEVAKSGNPFVVSLLVGDAAGCRETLSRIRDSSGCSDFVVLDMSSDHEARLESLERLAEACATPM